MLVQEAQRWRWPLRSSLCHTTVGRNLARLLTILEIPLAHETVLAQAAFNRKVRTYWLLSGALICTATVVGILLLPIWFLVGTHFTERYLKHMSCVLTERSLKVSRGIFVRQEQTVPLDKITDLALIEGPVMRCFDLQAIKVETAGHSSAGALITLVGIVDARKFRDTVLRQRDAVASAAHSAPTETIADPLKGSDELLREIRDTLMRIENKLP